MPDTRSDDANVRAGIAVIGVILACAALLWAWMEWKSSRRLEYVVWFPADRGVYGIKEGSLVRVGGIPLGEVLSVSPRFEAGHLTSYDVAFAIRGDVRLYQGVRIEATGDPVSGDGAIDIVRISERPEESDISGKVPMPTPLVAGTRIEGSDTPDFRTFAGANGSRHLRALAKDWAPLKDRYVAMYDGISARTRPIADDVRALVDQARADYRAWRGEFDRLRADADRAIEKLGPQKDAPPDAVLPALREVSRDVPMLTEAERSRMQFVDYTLRYAVGMLDQLRDHGREFATAMDDAEQGLAKGMADFSIASQELSATETEAIFAPWRLFAAPNAAERARAQAIDDARIFADSAVAFDRAMRAIREALERDAQLLRTTPGLADLLRAQLDAATRGFTDRSDRALRLLIGDPVQGDAPAPPDVVPTPGEATGGNAPAAAPAPAPTRAP